MSDLVDQTAGELIDGFFLLRRERAQPRSHARKLGYAQQLQLFLQPDDGRGHFAGLQTGDHALHFVGNDLFGLAGNLLPAAQVVVDHFLQIVDVVKIDVVDFIYRGIDVAWNSDIDEEHRAVAPMFDDLAHLLLHENVMWRGARSDDDVHPGKRADEA